FRILPLVEGLWLVESLVTLQANEIVVERLGEHLGELRLADAGRALDEDRLVELRGEVDDGPDRPARDVLERLEPRDDVVDGGKHRRGTLTHGIFAGNQ